MSNDSPNPTEPSTPEKKPRSKIERAIVWSVIGALLIVTGVEALARTGYNNTLTMFQDAIESATEPMTLEDFETKYKSGLAIKSKGEREGEETILYKWPSAIKEYELHLTVYKDNPTQLRTYSTGTGPAATITYRPASDNEGEGDANAMGQVGGGFPGGGGGFPGADGGAGRGGGGGLGGEARRGRNPLVRLLADEAQAELKLTDEQKTELQTFMESLRPDPNLSPEERAQWRETIQQQIDEKLKALLSEEQYTLAKEMLQQPFRGSDNTGRPQRPGE